MTLDTIIDPPRLSQHGFSFIRMGNCRVFPPIQNAPRMHLIKHTIMEAASVDDIPSFHMLIKAEPLNNQRSLWRTLLQRLDFCVHRCPQFSQKGMHLLSHENIKLRKYSSEE